VSFYLAATPFLAWALFCLLLGGYLEVTGAKPKSAQGGFVVVIFCMPFVALWNWVTGE
jgi:hypothetical protein